MLSTGYATIQKIMVGKIFKVLKEVSYAHQGCIYVNENTAKTVFKITSK